LSDGGNHQRLQGKVFKEKGQTEKSGQGRVEGAEIGGRALKKKPKPLLGTVVKNTVSAMEIIDKKAVWLSKFSGGKKKKMDET